MILSSACSTLSADEKNAMYTNCQKWALQHLEQCLKIEDRSLQKQMKNYPSATAKNLNKLPQAEAVLPPKSTESKDDKEKPSGCRLM